MCLRPAVSSCFGARNSTPFAVRLCIAAALSLGVIPVDAASPAEQFPSLSSVAAETATSTPASTAKRYGDADLKTPTRTTPSPDTSSPASAPSPVRGASMMRADVLQSVMPGVVTIESAQASGSGFFVARDTVVTNHHVVGDNASVRVRLLTGDVLSGTVARIALDADLAIVRLDQPAPATLRVLQLASTDAVRVGEDVMVLGSALGMLQGTVTRGIVSAVRSAGGLTLLQTDAAINPGNSGGPVINSRGMVVGITTAKMNGAESLGFAIASEHAARLVAGAESVANASSSTDAAPPFSGIGSGQTSGTRDLDRDAGSAQFDAVVRALAAQADQLDAYWQRYAAVCRQGSTSLPASERRAWFGIWESSHSDAESADCSAIRRDIVGTATAIDAAMSRASEAARRAGVFPGEARATRERYAMTWRGWDR